MSSVYLQSVKSFLLLLLLYSSSTRCQEMQKHMEFLVLSSFSGVASIILLSEVLDLLSCYTQRQTADFSRLPLILESILKELEELKEVSTQT